MAQGFRCAITFGTLFPEALADDRFYVCRRPFVDQYGNKMTETFFYGLFMDQDLLREKGLYPSNPRRGYVTGMGLRIGQRATLLHVPDEKAYGIVMTLSDVEISELYAEESVSDYRPEQVTVMLDCGASIEAACYNLPEHLLSGSNQAYAASLAQVAEKCGLPQDYVALIKRFEDE